MVSLRPSSSCLHGLPLLPVTSILPSVFRSVTCFRKQCPPKIWPIQLAFLLRIVCTIYLSSLAVRITSSFLTWSVQLIFSILLQHHISKLSSYFWCTFRSVQVSALHKPRSKCSILPVYSLQTWVHFHGEKNLLLVEYYFAIEILDLISCVWTQQITWTTN